MSSDDVVRPFRAVLVERCGSIGSNELIHIRDAIVTVGDLRKLVAWCDGQVMLNQRRLRFDMESRGEVDTSIPSKAAVIDEMRKDWKESGIEKVMGEVRAMARDVTIGLAALAPVVEVIEKRNDLVGHYLVLRAENIQLRAEKRDLKLALEDGKDDDIV